MNSTIFLRRILALDALSCLAVGLLMALGAGSLSNLLGLPEPLLFYAGLLLLPLAAFVFWLASRPMPPQALVWILIIGNLGWTAESFAIIAQRQPTPLGAAFVAVQALAVLGLAGLEYFGLRKAGVVA